MQLSVNVQDLATTPHDLASRFWTAAIDTERYYRGLAPPRHDFAVDAYLQHYQGLDCEPYLVPAWRTAMAEIERQILAGNGDLLMLPVVSNAIFSLSDGSWQRLSLAYLKERYPEDFLKDLLREGPPLRPAIFCDEFKCSETSLVHMAQLARYSELMERGWGELARVVEFGAGYGSMARLIRKLNPHVTLTIIDLPVMLILQKYYFDNIFGPEATSLMVEDGQAPRPGAINLVPVAFGESLGRLVGEGADLFVSTFALSETSRQCQEMLAALDFFGAEDVMLAYYHENTDALPNSTGIRLPPAYEVRHLGPAVFSARGDQLQCFARRGPQGRP